jgi:hypothetical protein
MNFAKNIYLKKSYQGCSGGEGIYAKLGSPYKDFHGPGDPLNSTPNL